jgi:hypothetical protein
MLPSPGFLAKGENIAAMIATGMVNTALGNTANMVLAKSPAGQRMPTLFTRVSGPRRSGGRQLTVRRSVRAGRWQRASWRSLAGSAERHAGVDFCDPCGGGGGRLSVARRA